jgi:hypothetical protein
MASAVPFFLPPFEHGQRASFNRHMRDNHQRLKKRKEEKKKGQRQLSSHGGETRESRPTTQQKGTFVSSILLCMYNKLTFLAFPCKLVKLSWFRIRWFFFFSLRVGRFKPKITQANCLYVCQLLFSSTTSPPAYRYDHTFIACLANFACIFAV